MFVNVNFSEKKKKSNKMIKIILLSLTVFFIVLCFMYNGKTMFNYKKLCLIGKKMLNWKNNND